MGICQSKKLSKKKLEELIKETNFSKSDLKKWWEVFYREYPTGKMDMESFIRENIDVHGGARELWGYLFKVLDRYGVGYLDFEQFVISLSIGSMEDVEAKLKIAFLMYDMEGKGYLDQNNVVKVLCWLFELENAASHVKLRIRNCAKRIFENMDVNHDGELTMEEFIVGCRHDPWIAKNMISL